MLDFPVLDLHNFCVGIILLDGIGENWDAGRSQILEYSHSFLIAGMYGMPSCQDSISPGEEDYCLISYASCCPIKGTLVLNTWWWSVVDTAIKIDWAGWLQKKTTGEQSSPPRALIGIAGYFLFCQLPDSHLGLEIFMNVDQFIIVYYLKKEVWGFENYSCLGLLASSGIILSGH